MRPRSSKPVLAAAMAMTSVITANSNRKIGSERELEALTDALRDQGIGLILDVVPNHMSISSATGGWMYWKRVPVLALLAIRHRLALRATRSGEQGTAARILEDQYGKVLENGKLHLVYDEGAFSMTTIPNYRWRLARTAEFWRKQSKGSTRC